MATINAVAHLNELTKEIDNDYYLTPQVKETLDVEGSIRYSLSDLSVFPEKMLSLSIKMREACHFSSHE